MYFSIFKVAIRMTSIRSKTKTKDSKLVDIKNYKFFQVFLHFKPLIGGKYQTGLGTSASHTHQSNDVRTLVEDRRRKGRLGKANANVSRSTADKNTQARKRTEELRTASRGVQRDEH